MQFEVVWNIVSVCMVLHKSVTQAVKENSRKWSKITVFYCIQHQKYNVHVGFALEPSTKKKWAYYLEE